MATQLERPADRRPEIAPPGDRGDNAEHAQEAPDPNRWYILFGLVLAVIMEALDTTIINVALPQMGGNLNATPNEIGWVSTSYILAVVIVLPITAWLASRFGRKRYLVASVLLFIVASFFCGTSRSLGEIIFWRVLQGMGGAALLSTAQATLLEIFPPDQQGIVQSILGLGVVVAPALAPMLGGYITDNYEWPWVFFVNLPIGAIAAFVVITFLQDSKFQQASAGSVDVAGIGLLATGLGSLQYVLEEGQQDDWFGSPLIVRLALVAGLALVGFVAWELSPANRTPVVDLRVLKDRNLLGGVLLALAMGFGLIGGLFIFPLFVQGILGFTPTETGLILFPAGIAIEVGILFCAATLQKGFDPRALIGSGILVFAFANWQLAHLSSQSDGGSTLPGQILRGLGLGLLFIPVTVSAYATLKGAAIAQGTALWNLSLQLGGSFGIAVLNTYVVDMTQYHRAVLVEKLGTGSTLFADRQAALTQTLLGHGYAAAQAQSGALGLINQTVQAQAQTLAYNNAFLLIGVLFVLAFPVLFLLKKPPGGGSAPPPV